MAKLDPIPLAEMDERTRELLTALNMGDGTEPLAELAHGRDVVGGERPAVGLHQQHRLRRL